MLSRYMSLFGNSIVLFILLAVAVVNAGSDGEANTGLTTDSIENVFPEKRPARSTWEYIVSAPLWVATSPLYLTYTFLSGTVEFMDDHSIPGKLERVIVSEDGSRRIEPYYSSTTGLGLAIWKKGLIAEDSHLKVAGSYGFSHRHGLETEWRSIPMAVKPLRMDAFISYHSVPDEPFFGIGSDNNPSEQRCFSYKDIISFCSIRYPVVEACNLYLAGTLDYYSTGTGRSDEVPSVEQRPSTGQPDGFNSSAIAGGAVAGVDFDTRDKSGRTNKGFLIKTHASFIRELDVLPAEDDNRTKRFGFYRNSVDASQFIPLPWGRGRTLVLRAALQQLHGMKDAVIPVYHLGTLGEDKTIRGFSRGRFRDRDVALVSSEYRFPVWWDYPFCLDAAVFVDAGQVSPDILRRFKTGNIHYGYGGGLRLYNHDELTAALYFGFSSDDYRLEIALGEDSLTRLLNTIKKMADI